MDADGFVTARRSQALAVRAEQHARNLPSLSPQDEPFRAGQAVPVIPLETAQILAEESKLSLPVAKLQLSRNDFSHPRPGPVQIAALKAAAPILTQEQLVKPGTDLNGVVDALIDVEVTPPVGAEADAK